MVTIKYIWQHAKLSYSEPKNAGWAGKFYFHQSKLDFCYMIDYGAYAILSFRGTDSDGGPTIALIKRWIRNFTVEPLLIDGGTIHHGFYDAWISLKPHVRAMVDRISKNSHLIITGHSLGADLAILAARDLVKNYNWPCKNIHCRAFAPAGIYTKKGIDEHCKLNIDTIHYVNGYDIVDCLPPGLQRPGFRGWMFQPWWHRLTRRFHDHLPESYEKAIEKL